jgi:hypothetical protein
LLLVVFAAHLLVMNAALGGTLLALLTPGRDRGAAGDLARRLPTAVAVTVNLGVPPLLFASVLYGQALYTAAILSAVAWLSLFMVVMGAYALLYVFQPRAAAAASGGIVALAALLLLAASLILVNASTLALRPESWTAYFDRPGGTILNLDDPTFWPRWLHFVAASLAVGGLFLALLNRKAAAGGDAGAAGRVRLGLAWFTRSTMAQFVVGLWFLFALPEGVRLLFLGGDAPHAAVLVAGVGLAGASLVQGLRGRVVRAAGFAVATVCVMVVVRELVRRASLAPRFLPESLPVLPQYGPFFLFLGSALVVGGATVWIVRAYRRAAGRG